jgi:hypothetical protein
MQRKIRTGCPRWTFFLFIGAVILMFIFWSVLLVINSVLTSDKDCHVTSSNYWNPIAINEDDEPDFKYGSCCTQSSKFNDLILCYGGFQPSESKKNNFWSWKNTKWTEVVQIETTTKPIKRAHSMCWLIDENFYLYGGETIDGKTLFNDFWKFNLRNKKWTFEGFFLQPRSRASFWLDEWKRLNIFGGLTIEFKNLTTKTSSEIITYDPLGIKKIWEIIFSNVNDCQGFFSKSTPTSKHHPPCRHSASIWYEKGHNFVVFGGEHKTQELLGDTWKWDGRAWILLSGNFSRNTPSRIKNSVKINKDLESSSVNHPSNRYGSCSWKTMDKFWMFSGMESTGLTKDLWSFKDTIGWVFEGSVGTFGDDIIGQNNVLLKFPSGRFYSSCWYVQENLYLYFGKDNLNQNWVFNLLD